VLSSYIRSLCWHCSAASSCHPVYCYCKRKPGSLWPHLGHNLFLGVVLLGVSLLTLKAVTMERLLALSLGLRFRQVITFRRTVAVVISFRFVNFVIAALCFWNYVVVLWYGCTLISICLITSTVAYAKIYTNLCRQQARVQDNQTETPLNLARYRKILSNSLWIQVTFLGCYIPYCVVTALATFTVYQHLMCSSIHP